MCVCVEIAQPKPSVCLSDSRGGGGRQQPDGCVAFEDPAEAGLWQRLGLPEVTNCCCVCALHI